MPFSWRQTKVWRGLCYGVQSQKATVCPASRSQTPRADAVVSGQATRREVAAALGAPGRKQFNASPGLEIFHTQGSTGLHSAPRFITILHDRSMEGFGGQSGGILRLEGSMTRAKSSYTRNCPPLPPTPHPHPNPRDPSSLRG